MRVAYELTALQLDRGGTARAIEQTLPLIKADPRVDLIELEHPGRVPTSKLGILRRGLARELRYLPRQLPKLVEQSGAQLLHCPSQLVPSKLSVPLVMTIHDAIGWEHPEWLTRANVLQLKKIVPRAVAGGAHLVTSSEYSRRRLAEALDMELSRITTIPLGLDARFTAAPAEDDAERRAVLGIDGPFVFTVGTLQPRKNVEAAIAAFERLPGAAEHKLVIAGARGWHDAELMARIDGSVARDRIVLLGRVPDEDLIALYRGAAAFVFPSRYEGFGFPPLEAMACGTPVLSTTNTSLAEAVGEAAVVLDPDSPEQIAGELARVLESSSLRDELIAKGHDQAAKFTWPKTAERTIELYERLISAS